MSDTYCIYHGKVYSFNFIQGTDRIKITSEEQEEGFEPNFNTIIKRTTPGLYSKFVPQSELDGIYSKKYQVKYKDDYFITLGRAEDSPEGDQMFLSTSDPDLAKKYDFYQKEPFVFHKRVPMDEIEELVVIVTALMDFEDRGEERTIIDKEHVREYVYSNPDLH